MFCTIYTGVLHSEKLPLILPNFARIDDTNNLLIEMRKEVSVQMKPMRTVLALCHLMNNQLLL